MICPVPPVRPGSTAKLIFCALRADAEKQPTAILPAAFRNSVPDTNVPGTCISDVNVKRLLKLDSCAGLFKLLLEVFGFVLGCTFLDG